MACMHKKLLCGLLASVPVLATNAAVADTFTFELTWSGQWAYGPDGPYGNSDAKASAVVVVEAPASDPNVSMDRIRSMTMTVGDAVVGNGTFSQRDFTSIATSYRLLPTLALNERFWLTSYNLYDFTFFGKGNGAPTQFANYTLWSGGVQGSNALHEFNVRDPHPDLRRARTCNRRAAAWRPGPGGRHRAAAFLAWCG